MNDGEWFPQLICVSASNVIIKKKSYGKMVLFHHKKKYIIIIAFGQCTSHDENSLLLLSILFCEESICRSDCHVTEQNFLFFLILR